jgi:CPA2 family monovalent cation:H+ antiporter-2
LNLLPGVVAGLALGWSPTEAIFLGGVTYPSSSGIVAKLLGDLRRMGNRETPVVLTTLVVEDLVMVAYLPIMGGILVGGSVLGAIGSVSLGIGAVALMLMIAITAGTRIAVLVFHRSDEALLLTLLGLALVVAGAAEALRISAAIGALLVGIMLSGPAAEGARSLLKPLRDLFAAMFFAVFGLSVDPGLLPGALPVAVGLAVVTAATKYVTGYLGSRRSGAGPRGRRRAGLVLIPRGEFSIAIAALAISGGVVADIGPLAAAYVLLLAVTGPVAVKIDDVLGRRAEAVAA